MQDKNLWDGLIMIVLYPLLWVVEIIAGLLNYPVAVYNAFVAK